MFFNYMYRKHIKFVFSPQNPDLKKREKRENSAKRKNE